MICPAKNEPCNDCSTECGKSVKEIGRANYRELMLEAVPIARYINGKDYEDNQLVVTLYKHPHLIAFITRTFPNQAEYRCGRYPDVMWNARMSDIGKYIKLGFEEVLKDWYKLIENGHLGGGND